MRTKSSVGIKTASQSVDVSTEATSVESHLVLLVLVCSDSHRVHEHADPDD